MNSQVVVSCAVRHFQLMDGKCCGHMQVVESCSWVYLDGTEARGSSSVTVITKYGRHTKFLFFQVWMPEIPLEVTLSDPQLSQIKGWKVPNQPTGSRSTEN